MKIAQIGPYPISADCIHGGVEASVNGLVKELVQQRHNVSVFDIPRINGKDIVERTENLIIHRYSNSGTHNKDAILGISVMVDDIISIQPQAIHIHGTGLFSAEIFYALCKRGYQPLITIHGLLRVEKKNALRKAVNGVKCRVYSVEAWKTLAKAIYQYRTQSRVECQLLEAVPMAIVDTEYLVDALKKYPVKRLPELHVIPQGANEKYYQLTKTTTKTKTILCVGAYGPRKSQINLLKAFEIIRSRGIGVKLNLCGIVADEAYYNQLTTLVNSSTYKSDITIQVNLPQEILYAQYEQAYLFALPSQEESQGIVLAEAMACGLPIVSTKVGGIPYVVESHTGILSEYGDIEGMARAMEMLLRDKALRQQMSKNAIEAALRYRWENIANKIIAIYNTTSDLYDN